MYKRQNFNDKTELFVELLRRETHAIDRDFETMLAAPVLDAAELQQKIVAYYSRLYKDDMFSVLLMEAKIVAVRDDKFRATLNAFLQERHEKLTEFVAAFARLTNTPQSAPAHHITIGLMALCEGICFAHRCDPQRIDGQTVEAILAWFIKTSIVLPTRQG